MNKLLHHCFRHVYFAIKLFERKVISLIKNEILYNALKLVSIFKHKVRYNILYKINLLFF